MVINDDGVLGPKYIDNTLACDYYRICVATTGVLSVLGASGHITSIKLNDQVICDGENMLLVFAPGDQSDSISKTIKQGLTEYLDLLLVTVDNRIVLATKDWRVPSSIDYAHLFTTHGTYRFHVVVTAPTIRAAQIDVDLKWAGDHKTAEMVCHAPDT